MAKSAAFSNATSLSSIPILLIIVSVTVLLYGSTVAEGGDSSAFVKKTISSHSIVIFSKSYCPGCLAKRAFKQFYTVRNLLSKLCFFLLLDDGWNIQDAISEIVGRRTVPQVFINGKHIGGSDDTLEAYENGDLAKLLGVNSKNDDL
ncbi:hypothetical protein EJD97_005307 [Solanum chilense]|uniref:Glutaredoxin domain-containing protein n=1 Tax=Solanum chilense TaxID=4083 RepID=A0A6N2AMF6_SOLCI|nr:hypothetical protein EJD97_005307 [Solanum chilense]